MKTTLYRLAATLVLVSGFSLAARAGDIHFDVANLYKNKVTLKLKSSNGHSQIIENAAPGKIISVKFEASNYDWLEIGYSGNKESSISVPRLTSKGNALEGVIVDDDGNFRFYHYLRAAE